jgi:serpin B
MHPSTLSRRRFLTLSGVAAAGALFTRAVARACPNLEDIGPATNLANAINAFATDLHTRLARDEKGSLFFSPFSIETALAMTSAGARGETLEEMQKTLHLPDEPHAAFGDLLNHLNGPNFFRAPRKYQLSVANAIWAQKGYPWRKEFIELTRKHYGAGMVEVDFSESEAARKRINDWVEDETREKIKDLIPAGAITVLTRMVLANAIYFKGDWQVRFDKKLTQDAPFTRADGTKANVPLMHQTAEFGYGEFEMGITRQQEKVQVLELPYSGRELSMLVYLPRNPDGVDWLAQWLSKENLGAPELKQQKVRVYLPRFKAESKFRLNEPLMDLGMKKAFGGADFTGMSPNGKDLSISHVLHKAFVDVNEEGTEAAAATGVIIKERVSAPAEPVVFRADRPFVFAIRDNKTGAALFVGRYSGPA